MHFSLFDKSIGIREFDALVALAESFNLEVAIGVGISDRIDFDSNTVFLNEAETYEPMIYALSHELGHYLQVRVTRSVVMEEGIDKPYWSFNREDAHLDSPARFLMEKDAWEKGEHLLESLNISRNKLFYRMRDDDLSTYSVHTSK